MFIEKDLEHSTGLNNREYGFTIIELAIVLLISSIMLVSLLEAWKISTATMKQEATREAVKEATEALSDFGRAAALPCPANPTLKPSDPQYGYANCNTAIKVNGIDANKDGVADVVYVGDLPKMIWACVDRNGTSVCDWFDFNMYVKIKGINSSNFRDAYGNDLKYAVTELATQLNTNKKYGAINIKDEFNRSLANAYYVVFSRGELNNCPSISASEQENCNNDAVFVNGVQRSTYDANHFDDYVYYKSYTDNSLWQDIGTTGNARNSNGTGKVGIGKNLPAEKLDVNGDIVAGSAINTRYFQDKNTGEKVDISTLSALSCPTGKYMKSISINSTTSAFEAECTDLVIETPPNGQRKNCAWGVKGIDSDGTVHCATRNGSVK